MSTDPFTNNGPYTPRKRRTIDRFIPQREALNLHTAYNLAGSSQTSLATSSSTSSISRLVGDSNTSVPDRNNGSSVARLDGSNVESTPASLSTSPSSAVNSTRTPPDETYDTLLKAELFGSDISHALPSSPSRSLYSSTDASPGSSSPTTPRRLGRNVLRYSPARRHHNLVPTDLFSSSPVRLESQALLLSPKKKVREVAKTPYRVLDAPNLADDFYLNLVDWGQLNKMAVGLTNMVYIWDASDGTVQELLTLEGDDMVTSVKWVAAGTHLAVGTLSGDVQIWDVEAGKRLRQMSGHCERTSSLAWNNHILTSGSRDCTALHRDVRAPEPYVARLTSHAGEVCGLRWNSDLDMLASGCNGNKLNIWAGLNTEPVYTFTRHEAAVKALAWSPHQRGLLASGGGSSDMSICFWNALTGSALSRHRVGSQVSNLEWSHHTRELVSSHGYAQNHIAIWKYPSMQRVATLTGHTYRVLYMSMSPDKRTIVTGAGDETLRLWSIFDEPKRETKLDTDLFRNLR